MFKCLKQQIKFVIKQCSVLQQTTLMGFCAMGMAVSGLARPGEDPGDSASRSELRGESRSYLEESGKWLNALALAGEKCGNTALLLLLGCMGENDDDEGKKDEGGENRKLELSPGNCGCAAANRSLSKAEVLS